MPMHQVTLESANAKGSLPGYVSNLDGHQKQGVIVIQEAWGVNDQIKGLAERWFGDKYLVIVPDLYRGTVIQNLAEVRHLTSSFDWPGAVHDIQGAINYLKSRGVEKIGITGFCMGGALSIASAVKCDGLNVAAPFYGIPNPELANPGQSKVPMQCHFAQLDQHKPFSDPESANALEQALKDNKVPYEFYRYENADHGFVNETREKYNEAGAKLAQQRVTEFFAKHLHI